MRQSKSFISVPATIAPAPWQLRGSGYVFFFRYSKDFLLQNGFLCDYQRSRLKLGLGAIILVDYEDSEVGAYRELVFVPGIFKHAGHYTLSISKCYVSTLESQWNGRENWGIPKELAEFDIQPAGVDSNTTEEKWVVRHNGHPFFSVNLRRHGMKFPVGTTLIPFRIGQVLRDSLLITDPSFAGKGQLVKSADWFADPDHFPCIDSCSLLGGFSMCDFTMKFPTPRMFKAE